MASLAPQVGPNPFSSTDSPFNLGALPKEVYSRIGPFLDSQSIGRLARANQNCCIGVMGGMPGVVRTDPGYHLRGRVQTIGAFAEAVVSDFASKIQPFLNSQGMGEVQKQFLLAFLKRTQESFVKAVGRVGNPKVDPRTVEETERVFGQLYNLLTFATTEVTPKSPLSDAEARKIQQGYCKLHDLVVAMATRQKAYERSHPIPAGENPLEVSRGYINLLRKDGLPQVSNSKIEKVISFFVSSIFDSLPNTPVNNLEETDGVIREIVQFEIAQLPDEEILQLANTLEKTFPLVKSLYDLYIKTVKEEIVNSRGGLRQRLGQAGAIAGALGQALLAGVPNGYLLGTYGITAITAYSAAYSFFSSGNSNMGLPSIVSIPLSFIGSFGPPIATIIGMQRLYQRIHSVQSSVLREGLALMSGIAIAAVLTSYSPFLQQGTECLQIDWFDSIRSFMGDRLLLENDPTVMGQFLVSAVINMLAFRL